jgi:hypothetical protein
MAAIAAFVLRASGRSSTIAGSRDGKLSRALAGTIRLARIRFGNEMHKMRPVLSSADRNATLKIVSAQLDLSEPLGHLHENCPFGRCF